MVDMVVVNGVRYRPEDAPKDEKRDTEQKPAENKARTTRTTEKK